MSYETCQETDRVKIALNLACGAVIRPYPAIFTGLVTLPA